MFRRCKIRVGKYKSGRQKTAIFYVRSKPCRGGFVHEAVCIGPLPDERLWESFRPKCPPEERTNAIFRLRYAKVRYCNRTYEDYDGQDALAKLWDQLVECEDLDMPKKNPFRLKKEPRFEEMPEPDEMFSRFSS